MRRAISDCSDTSAKKLPKSSMAYGWNMKKAISAVSPPIAAFSAAVRTASSMSGRRNRESAGAMPRAYMRCAAK